MNLNKSDVNALMQQINQALNVAADQIGKDPSAAKDMLMALIGSLDSSANPTPVNPSSPTVPTGGAQGDGIGKTVTPSAAPSTPEPEKTAPTTPVTPSTPSTPDSYKEMMDKVNALTETVAKLAEAVAQKPAPAPVEKAVPAGDLAALLKMAQTPDQPKNPVLDMYLSGDRNALHKAAVLAGSTEHPDFEAVNRIVDTEYQRMAGPKFTRLMLAQGIASGVPDLQ